MSITQIILLKNSLTLFILSSFRRIVSAVSFEDVQIMIDAWMDYCNNDCPKWLPVKRISQIFRYWEVSITDFTTVRTRVPIDISVTRQC